MSHVFSQPEEIDLALMERSGNTEEANSPILDGARFNSTNWSGG